ncbi:MAG: 3-keto-disaccharide hydrolase [Bacteroidales bacterium]
MLLNIKGFPASFSCLVIIAVLFADCKDRKTVIKQPEIEKLLVPDSTYIFDGKTLSGWEITNFGTQGAVDVSGGKIYLGMGDGCTGITYKRDFPLIDYEVTLEAMRVEGIDFFCGMTFPVDKYPCTLIVGGWGGTVVGLSSINGKDASENETTRYMNFEKNRWYTIRLRVTADKIEAWIDDEKVVNLLINGKKLSIRPEVELSKPFGIASWRTTAALRNIRVERISKN